MPLKDRSKYYIHILSLIIFIWILLICNAKFAAQVFESWFLGIQFKTEISWTREYNANRDWHVTYYTIAALFTWYFAVCAGLATRFRTHTHARAIDDNVRENDLCHAVPIELRPLTSRITNFDRAPIVSHRLSISINAHIFPLPHFHQSFFIFHSTKRVTFVKTSHYMFSDTHGHSINHWNDKSAIRGYRRIPFD